MKILIIIEGFFPGEKYGGPPVSVDNFCTLMNNHKCYIVTKNHDLRDTNPYEDIKTGEWIDRKNYMVLYLSDSSFNKAYFENIIKEIKPNLIYLQSLFQRCVIPCLILAKKYNIKVLLAPRGELCSGAFKKKYKKIPYIMLLRLMGWIDNISYQSTSEEEANAIHKILKAPKNNIYSLANVPSIPKNQHDYIPKKSGSANFVFLSRIVRKKNLISAIQYFKHVKGSVNFDIYGAIEDESYWKECEKEISKLPKNVKVRYCGIVNHDNVHYVLSKYDALLLPTYSENFGHVIAEALFAGCPVIISDQTPWSDVEDVGAGWAYPLDQVNSFVNAIQNIIDSNEIEQSNRRRQVMEYINSKFQLDELKSNYEKSFRCILNKSE